MNRRALASRDLPRSAIRVAFTVAWALGALVVLALSVTLASAAS